MKDKHFPVYLYLGPASRLDIRLNKNHQPWQGDEPISPTDQLALHHDIAYRNADRVDPETALQLKHDADKIMVEQLDRVKLHIIDKFANFTAKKILQLKLKLGMSINPFIADSLISAMNRTSQSATLISGGKLEALNAEQIANQLHKPIRHKFSRRKVIVYNLEEIWICDLMDFS